MNKTIHPTNEEAFGNLNAEQREWVMANTKPSTIYTATPEQESNFARIQRLYNERVQNGFEPKQTPDPKPAQPAPQQLREYLETRKAGMVLEHGYSYGPPPEEAITNMNPTLVDPKPLKFDEGKVDWAILPLSAVEEIIKVFQFGEHKYARGNFAHGEGLEYTRVLNSLLRHTTSFMRGEDNDPETGKSHMAHAGCCVLMLLHFITHKDQFSNNDDRAGKILK